MMTIERLKFELLPVWHQKIIINLLNTTFVGRDQIKLQLETAYFEIIDKNGSLKIYPQFAKEAPIEKTIPVESWAYDSDGILIQILLFTINGVVNMLEIIREDGKAVFKMPFVEEFKVIVLGV